MKSICAVLARIVAGNGEGGTGSLRDQEGGRMDSTNSKKPKALSLLAAILAGSMMLAPAAHAVELVGTWSYGGSVDDTFDIQSNGGVNDSIFGSDYINFTITNDAMGFNAATFADSNVVGTNGGLGYNLPQYGTVAQFWGDEFSPVIYDGSPPSTFNIRAGTYVGGGGDTLTFTSAAPEPATWAMMLLGIGGVGAALRSRRKVVFSAA